MRPPAETKAWPKESILISYVQPAAPPVSRAVKMPEAAAKPAQNKTKSWKPNRFKAISSAFSRMSRTAITRPSKNGTRGSEELLADPQKGKIFSDYFVMVKEKIRQTVRRRAVEEEVGRGSVALFFILNSDGRLENVSVIENQSPADQALKAFAVESLKKTAPFASFPAPLGVEKISFSVIVAFDDPTT